MVPAARTPSSSGNVSSPFTHMFDTFVPMQRVTADVSAVILLKLMQKFRVWHGAGPGGIAIYFIEYDIGRYVIY